MHTFLTRYPVRNEYSHISNTLLQFACNNSFHYTPAIPTAADVAFVAAAAAAAAATAAHISASLIRRVILQELVTRLTVLSALLPPVYIATKLFSTIGQDDILAFCEHFLRIKEIFLLLLFVTMSSPSWFAEQNF